LLRSGTRNIAIAAGVDRKDFYNEANNVATSAKQIHAMVLSVTGDSLDGFGKGGMTLWGVSLTNGDVDLGGNPANQTTDRGGPRTENRYHKWSANIARLQRLSDKATLWASANAQWASKNLDSSEKMSLGGPSAVRAYPVSEANGDEGWQATVEGRYNLTPELQLTAFYDYGRLRRDYDPIYTGALLPTLATLKGSGLSVNWTKAGAYALRATVARRQGDNPFRTIATGKDTDGSYDLQRLWLTGMVFF
jgi:hemolysin activation/secretion protein